MKMKTLALGLCALALASAPAVAQVPDRSAPPKPGPPPQVKLPPIQKRQLANGLRVWIVELHEVPVAQVDLILRTGSAADPPGKEGLASLTAAMLGHGMRSNWLTRSIFSAPKSPPEAASTRRVSGCTCRSRDSPTRCRS
jgi:hypothetical protein